jgi:molybdopterin molybdotransferase
MIGIDEALTLVLQHTSPLLAAKVTLREAVGTVLAEDLVSDLDVPPHDKAVVDGFAVRARDVLASETELAIVETVTAGQLPQHPLAPQTAVRIMTGAPLPMGADAVVMREHAEASDHQVRILKHPVHREQNVLRQGAITRRGETVLAAGHTIRPVEIGILAEMGKSSVWATPAPRVAILATGNELVPADCVPQAGQIRNSNGPMLCALCRAAGAHVSDLDIARDSAEDLSRRIAAGLNHDVLIVSGGVSAGDVDLVPNVLTSLDVRCVFHKVRVKPGKPIWFGTAPSGALVFGLPGNPVSSLVGFHLFVTPALAQMGNRSDWTRPELEGRLTTSFSHRGDRPTYHPARAQFSDRGMTRLQLVDWKGSADLRSLAGANCLVCFPAGDVDFAQDAVVTYIPL